MAWLFSCTQGTGFNAATVLTVDVFLQTGQSNNLRPGIGEAGTLASVKYNWNNTTNGTSSGGWVALTGPLGVDFRLGRLLDEAGLNVAILNVTEGSSFANEWSNPAADEFPPIMAAIEAALESLRDLYPEGTIFRFHSTHNQGTSDQRLNNITYQRTWAALYNTWMGHLKAKVDEVMGGDNAIDRLIVMNYTGMTSSFFVPVLCWQQRNAAGGTPPSNDTVGPVPAQAGLMQMEGNAAWFSSSDGFVHYTTTGCNHMADQQAAHWIALLAS